MLRSIDKLPAIKKDTETDFILWPRIIEVIYVKLSGSQEVVGVSNDNQHCTSFHSYVLRGLAGILPAVDSVQPPSKTMSPASFPSIHLCIQPQWMDGRMNGYLCVSRKEDNECGKITMRRATLDLDIIISSSFSCRVLVVVVLVAVCLFVVTIVICKLCALFIFNNKNSPAATTRK